MIEPEWVYGIPFYTVTNERMEAMTIGELVEELINIKRKYDIGYPDDNAINNACNILDKLPRTKTVYEILSVKNI